MPSLNPTIFISAIFANFLAARLSGIFLPDQYYFSFSAFLFDTRDLDKPLAIAIKLMVPFGLAFLISISVLFLRKSRSDHGFDVQRLDTILNDQLAITLGYSAMFTAILMAWPNILLWDILVRAELQPYKLLFFAAYLAYFVSVCFFAQAGANLAFASFGQTPGSGINIEDISGNRFVKPLWETASGAISAGLATFLATRIG